MNMDIKSMKSASGTLLRCAAYVRKSTEDGLEQDYNSLDCQFDAISAYVKSQALNGWTLNEKSYSDGGFSGGTTERPGLKEMRADIAKGLIDIVVVYKIDRLSRSIWDFCELSKEFERHNVRFVSVTQMIDTSTAVGRMLLNILVSFGQFEREMASDRIKDKIRASKEKGIWVGGIVPFGYKSVNKKLIVDQPAAEQVQKVFSLYAQTGRVGHICKEMTKGGFLRNGTERWEARHVNACLRNPRYLGMLPAGDRLVKGEHEAIIPQALWDKVQNRISSSHAANKVGRSHIDRFVILKGLVYCGICNSAMHYRVFGASKNRAKRYAYYSCNSVSAELANCTVKRIPSAILESEVDHHVFKVLSSSFELSSTIAKAAGIDTLKLISALSLEKRFASMLTPEEHRNAVCTAIKRITVFEEHIEIDFRLYDINPSNTALESLGEFANGLLKINFPIAFKFVSGIRRLNGEASPKVLDATRLKSNPLLQAIVRGHAWMKLIDNGTFKSVIDLAEALKLDRHFVSRTLRLVTLSPRIISAIINGTEPNGLSLDKIRHVTTDSWTDQEAALGFSHDKI